MDLSFTIVDVFAEKPFGGNPLAVVFGAEQLAADTMLQVAGEMNFSETAFVSSIREPDGAFPVRFFTPSHEVSFVGHPILGTAWVINKRFEPELGGLVRLKLGVGAIEVRFDSAKADGQFGWFLAPPIKLEGNCPRERIAPALGIDADDIDPLSPVQCLGSGTSALVVPIQNLETLKRCRLDLAAFAALAEEGFPPLVYLFCRETRNSVNDLSARFFFDSNGAREDPATGNGAAFLGDYLLRHNYFPAPLFLENYFQAPLFLRIEQGHEMGRPSLVLLRAKMIGGEPKIHVGGKVIPVVQGGGLQIQGAP